MTTLNLDKVRAEQNADPKAIEVGGQTFALPTQLTMATFKALSKMQNADAEQAIAGLDVVMRALFGDQADAAGELVAPSDLELIVQTFYGATPGESSASSVS